jgi:hypothetical protein
MIVAFFVGRNLPSSPDHVAQTNTALTLGAMLEERDNGPAATVASNPPTNDSTQVIADSLLGANSQQSVAFALNQIGALSPDQVRSLIGTAYAMPKSASDRSQVINALLTQLAATAPIEAMQLADQIGSLRDAERAQVAILEVWASRDPTAALTWAKTALVDEPSSQRNLQMRAIIRGYAETNPTAAFLYVNSLEATSMIDIRQKNDLLSEVIETQIENGGLNEARTRIEMLAAGSTKDSLLRDLVNEWASFDPDSAAAYVTSLGADASASLKTTLIGEWAENDPVAAAAWLSTLPEGDPAIANSTAEIIREWTRYDLNAPAEWLNSLPASPELDRAVASYTFRVAEEDPENAMGWAQSISNEKVRTYLMQSVAANWKNTDVERFTAYLEQSDLSAEQKTLLENAKMRRGYGRWGGSSRR